MLCKNLARGNQSQPFPCGQCINCRVNAQRKLVTRILLELAACPDSSFVTLTYSPDHVPRLVDGTHTLSKRDFQLFLARLRKKTGRPFRYFLAGEYGSKTQRPHAHGIFTLSPLEMETHLRAAWSRGFVDIGTASRAAAFYSSGYVTKKMTRREDERLNGRSPEFSLRSKRPALGASMIPQITSTIQRYPEWTSREVPTELRISGKLWPLDRFMRTKLRESLGLVDQRRPVLEWPADADLLAAEEKAKWLEAKMEKSSQSRPL